MCATPSSEPLATERARQATAAAKTFLENQQSSDGLWRDFVTLAGESSEWVGAFVLHALRLIDPTHPSISTGVRALLRHQRPCGGWGYNASVPPDADSTAWALLAMAGAAEPNVAAIDRARQYLLAHQHHSGGFSTYLPSDGIDRYLDVPDPTFTTGWCLPHTCLTGSAIQALVAHGEASSSASIRTGIAYLKRAQEPAGTWDSYWWRGFSYPTYQALAALALERGTEAPRRTKCAATLIETQHTDGSWNDAGGQKGTPFATAFGLLSLLTATQVPGRHLAESSHAACAWLVNQQRDDGSWRTAPTLRIPAPNNLVPTAIKWHINGLGTGVVIADRRRIFTTAATLWALSAYSHFAREYLS